MHVLHAILFGFSEVFIHIVFSELGQFFISELIPCVIYFLLFVVSLSASFTETDCLKRRVSEMIRYVSGGIVKLHRLVG